MLKNQRLSLALALALGTQQAFALGLGAIEVKSGLNQSLVAEIPVVSSRPGETENLKVSLASPEAFARIGVDRPAIMAANLKFTVERDGGGATVIRVTTPDKIKDPYLNFLLEVDTGRGRMLREYTVLLDPPVLNPVRSAPAVSAPATRSPVAEPSPAPSSALPPPEPARPPVATPPTQAQPAQPAQPATPAAQTQRPATPTPPPATPTPTPPPSPPAAPIPNRFGPVARGQTLWSVAQQVRPDDRTSANQIMLALLRANPDAFIDGNINRLKSGAVLRIPTADEYAAVDAADAAQQVREQNEQWRGAATPQPVRPSQPDTAAPSRPAATPVDSRLEVVPPAGDNAARQTQSGAAAAAEGRELRADLARAREQVSTLTQENLELQSRVSDLEKIDRDTRRLIELKDSQLAEAQRRLAELEAARSAESQAAASPAATADESAIAAEPATDADGGVAVDDAAGTDDSLAAVDAAGEDIDAAAADDGVTDEVSATDGTVDADGFGQADEAAEPVSEPLPSEPPPVAVTETPAEAPAETPLWRNPMVVGGLGALLVGVLVLLGLRGRKQPEPARRGVSEAYAAATAGALPSSEAAAADSDAAQEQVLLDSIAEQPDDLSRHLALVRHYHQIGDASGFEGAAEAMYAQLYDPEDRAWRDVVVMGREILPDHPLFAVADEEGASFAARLDEARAAPADDDADEVAPPAGSSEHVDWGLPPAAPAVRPVEDVPAEPQFDEYTEDRDQYSGDAGIEDVEAVEPEPEAEPSGVNDTQTFSIEELDRMAEHREPATDDAGYDLDLGQPIAADADALAGATPSDDDAAATKLELARAYLDMGDVEGARGMLEEVVNEGNPGQRSEAKRLIDEIR